MVPLCTLPVPLGVKSIFLRTRYRYEKAILYPLSQLNDLKICTWPEQTWSLEKLSQLFRMCPGPSFMAKYNCGRAEKSFANF